MSDTADLGQPGGAAPSRAHEGAHASPAAPQPGRRALRDLLLVVALSIAVFVGAGRVELYEAFSGWVAGYERWQVDEAPLALLTLSLGLGWFAWRRWLEQRVQTAARGAAEERVATLLARNRELAQRLLTLQEQERRALARELHDELGQSCNAIRVDAACILNGLERDPKAVATSARAIADTADSLYQLVHRLLRQLRPAALDAAGLVAALEELCGGWERRHGVACSLTCGSGLADVAEPLSITAYRVVQEALTNVARHAGADWVRVDLRIAPAAAGGASPPVLHIAIRDNGRGLPPAPRSGGLGLLGMNERVSALGGELRVHSTTGEGVSIEASLPLATTAGA